MRTLDLHGHKVYFETINGHYKPGEPQTGMTVQCLVPWYKLDDGEWTTSKILDFGIRVMKSESEYELLKLFKLNEESSTSNGSPG